ncbi:MAG: ABC transporter ATP-binding protein [Clostridium sp.]|nr:ABC transporter ATP-binding protein [Clostridium sp.]
MSIIEVKDLRKSYIDGDGKKEVLKGITFSAKENEFVVILGKSGSGKSTFMNILGGLDKADEGTILIDGQPLVNGTDKEMSRYRRNTIGFIFQSFNLIPVMNVYENIVLPLRIDGKKIEDSYIDDLLNNLDIMDKKNSMPMKLSGGEQQRVAIARALANKPRIILADEPTGNLDSATGDKVLELLISGIRKYGQTLIMITHNEEIANMADRVVYMREGQLLDK